MAGTTAKLRVVEAGEPRVVFGFEAARQARFIEVSGLPIRISTVDLIEIGAAFDTRTQQRLNRGDVLTIRTPGGGGYG